MGYSPAHIILEAVRLATDTDVEGLRKLAAQHASTLKLDLVLRILLTYLPESTDPSIYTGFLGHLVSGSLSALDGDGSILTSTQELSHAEARCRVRKLHLLPLSVSPGLNAGVIDSFTAFLLNRAHRIDSETGALPLLQRLLEPFLDHSTYLRTWFISTLLPLLRLDYEYYPHRAPAYSLELFEALRGRAAVDTLLSEASQQASEEEDTEVATTRDLKGLVGPWMYGHNKSKRRKLSKTTETALVQTLTTDTSVEDSGEDSRREEWGYVNDWLLDLSSKDFSRAVRTVEQWNGPIDVDYGGWSDGVSNTGEDGGEGMTRYAQVGLAMIYSARDTSAPTFEGSESVLQRVSQILDLPVPATLLTEDMAPASPKSISAGYIASLTTMSLAHEQLLRVPNPFTEATESSIELASLALRSSRILQTLGYPQSTKASLTIAVFGTALDQKDLLRKTMYAFRETKGHSKDDEAWEKFRHELLWLRDWGNSNKVHTKDLETRYLGVFCQIDWVELETDILRALLTESRFHVAINIYCKKGVHPIPLDQVEKLVLEIAFSFYDNASNGNKSRGGVKKASDLITAFQPHFPTSQAFKQIKALILATHALSFYSLTLQRGVPLQPVNIRISPDALSLIDKVLEQNPRSYTKLDDLLDIGRNLVRAGLVKSDQFLPSSPPPSHSTLDLKVERRLITKAIEASLAEGDFDTAYSYVVNRLSLHEPTQTSSEPNDASTNIGDNITWQAAYAAGRSRAKAAGGPSELRRIEQRMELLSQALLLAPATSLAEVLATWRECEEEMNRMLAQEEEEEEKWDGREDRTLPGGFGIEDFDRVAQKPREPTRNAMNEEAPMGLFDVARGAAAAFSKTAFPLRAPRSAETTQKAAMKIAQRQPASPTGSDASTPGNRSSMDGEGRVRKRDMVSNMVTGGLASGIGWVLGAPPVRHD
ncbi:hypothetical protein MMC30_005807 [Trapelia coarctata]|nr:hypothetical protein [Trapelia coarctata]